MFASGTAAQQHNGQTNNGFATSSSLGPGKSGHSSACLTELDVFKDLSKRYTQRYQQNKLDANSQNKVAKTAEKQSI